MFGGAHTIHSAAKCQLRWETWPEEKKKGIRLDPRWIAWHQKTFIFPGRIEEYRDLLLFLAEADNTNYRLVIFTFYQQMLLGNPFC